MAYLKNHFYHHFSTKIPPWRYKNTILTHISPQQASMWPYVQTVANQQGQRGQLDKRDTIAEIAENRVKHIKRIQEIEKNM